MLETKQKTIDGLKFVFRPLMATQARKVLVQLVNRFGGSIAAGLEGLGEVDFTDTTKDTDVTDLLSRLTGSAAGIIRELSTNLTPDYYEDLVQIFGDQTDIEIKSEQGQASMMKLDKPTRDAVFATKLLTEAKWIGFCMEVQFSDFFGLVQMASQRAIALKALAQMRSQSSSQKD